MTIHPSRHLLGVNLANPVAVSPAAHSTSRNEQEVQSLMTDNRTFTASDFIHGSAELRMLARLRGGAGDAKPSVRRCAQTVSRACRVFITLENAGAAEGKRPADTRANHELATMLPKIKRVLTATGAKGVDEDMPGPRGFRRALRDYERACAEAVKILNFIMNNN